MMTHPTAALGAPYPDAEHHLVLRPSFLHSLATLWRPLRVHAHLASLRFAQRQLFRSIIDSAPVALDCIDWFGALEYTVNDGEHLTIADGDRILAHESINAFPGTLVRSVLEDAVIKGDPTSGRMLLWSMEDDDDRIIHGLPAYRNAFDIAPASWHCRIFDDELNYSIEVARCSATAESSAALRSDNDVEPDGPVAECTGDDCLRVSLLAHCFLLPLEYCFRGYAGDARYSQVASVRHNRAIRKTRAEFTQFA